MKSHKIIPALAAVLVLSFPAWAQQSEPQIPQQSGGAATPVQPISTQSGGVDSQGAAPAARGLFVGYENQDNGSTTQTGPDDRLLSGVETLSLGVLHSLTTLIDPSFFVTESIDNGLAPGSWVTATTVGGGLGLVRDWNRAQITAQYFGGQSIYPASSQYDGSYHDLSIAQATHFGRWGLMTRDDFTYSRSSTFGGFQTGGIAPATGTGSITPLQPGIAPAETIVTGQVSTLNNTTVGQGSYALSRRSAVTFSAGFGFLHFAEAGYIDSHTWSGSFGYNYSLSRLNSIAGVYSFSQDNFNGSVAKATTHTVQAAFSRKITGRLVLQAAAGPQLAISRNSFGLNSGSQFSWAASSSLTYGPRPRHVSYTAAYAHGLTSGSGVFYGSESDTITGSVQAAVGRSWSGTLDAGYASNRSLAGAAGFSATRFDNWFAGANINRSLGRHLLMTMTYQYQHQYSNGSCPVFSCGITPDHEAVFARVQWRPWPARIR